MPRKAPIGQRRKVRATFVRYGDPRPDGTRWVLLDDVEYADGQPFRDHLWMSVGSLGEFFDGLTGGERVEFEGRVEQYRRLNHERDVGGAALGLSRPTDARVLETP